MKITISILLLFVCFGCIVKKKSDKAVFNDSDFPNENDSGFTWIITNRTTTPNIALSLRGADDFNCDSGIVTIDYDDYAKDTPVTGFLTSEQWDRFVSKQRIYTDETIDKYDTQKVIMLVCDTSSFNAIGVGYKTLPIHDQNIYWQYGYEVCEIITHADNVIELGLRHDCAYLDADKKPLSKSIIVWQTKELK